MFARPQPSSPLSTAYTNTQLHTPGPDVPPIPNALKTPSKLGGVDHPTSFPPPLGSSSPPMSSPTSYREHPSFTHASDTERSRTHSSAGLFAARARAIQPPIQRSSSLVNGDAGSSAYGSLDGGMRYGPRPGLRRTMTGGGGGGGGVFGDAPGGTTGFSLACAPPSGRSARSNVPLVPSTAEDSIQGSLWKGKFRRRCIAVSEKKEERARDRRGMGRGRGSLGPEDAVGEVDDREAEAEHEEIFRRMIQKEQRRVAHTMAVSFEQEVGGSDPAVWEAELRDAEAAADGSDGGDVTPEKGVQPQWQYRSTRKPCARGQDAPGSSGNGKKAGALFHEHRFEGTPPRREEEEEEQLAQFLREEEVEAQLLEEYASEMVHREVGEDGGVAGDTPGAGLNVEMEGFTWEDGPLSDEDRDGEDVDMA